MEKEAFGIRIISRKYIIIIYPMHGLEGYIVFSNYTIKLKKKITKITRNYWNRL